MKQVRTDIWCDAHLARDVSEEVEGQPQELTINDDGPVELDMCPACVEQLLEPLRKLMATYGQPIKQAPKKRVARKPAAATKPVVSKSAPVDPAETPQLGGDAGEPEKPKRRRSPKAKPTPAEIRAWAVEQGLEIPDRGRVPQTIQDAFQEAQGKSKAKAKV